MQTPQLQDLQPKGDPPIGSSQALTLPPQGRRSRPDEDHHRNGQRNEFDLAAAARHPVRRRKTSLFPEQTIPVVIPSNLLPLINVDPSAHLVEARAAILASQPSSAPVIKGDLDGTGKLRHRRAHRRQVGQPRQRHLWQARQLWCGDAEYDRRRGEPLCWQPVGSMSVPAFSKRSSFCTTPTAMRSTRPFASIRRPIR